MADSSDNADGPEEEDGATDIRQHIAGLLEFSRPGRSTGHLGRRNLQQQEVINLLLEVQEYNVGKCVAAMYKEGDLVGSCGRGGPDGEVEGYHLLKYVHRQEGG